eukprot:gene7451-8273_t
MNNNPIELRTIRKNSVPDEQGFSRHIGLIDNSSDPSSSLSKLGNRPRPRPKSVTEGPTYDLNTKRQQLKRTDMYSAKKPEKKAGLREWLFGKTSKTHKPKVANMPRSESGPIVERLQKQSAYLRATMKNNEEFEERTISPNPLKSQNDQNYSNYDEFVYKRHLLQIHARPTWCDVCEDFIWGIYRSAVRCKYCRYTCHYRCHLDINLECPKAPMKERSLEDLTKETLHILSEATSKGSIEEEEIPAVSLPKSISSVMELRRLIDKYNASSSLIMSLQDDGVFHGFVRVLMNLNRPVNVHADTSDLSMKRALRRSNSKRVSKRHQSVTAGMEQDNLKDALTSPTTSTLPTPLTPSAEEAHPQNDLSSRKFKRSRRRMSFYMPKNTKKPLHITSTTTAYEVIEALLDKYGVTDNPQKFALYERTEENDRIRLRKMDAEEHPLVLSLLWESEHEAKSFSLQENERGEILWEAFEMPELQNFLTFLNREEEEMMSQIRKKYEDQKRVLQEVIDLKRREGPDSEC